MFRATIGRFSLPGGLRSNCDAAGYVERSDGSVVLAIADGVGAAEFGGDAARLAVATCTDSSSLSDVEPLFASVHELITSASSSAPGQWSTTLSLCLIHDQHANVGHVGDTRIYHLRGGGLLARTSDQTEVERLIEEGVLTRERARFYPRRNVLLSAMSNSSPFDLQRSEFELLDGDRLLLLSDGVYRQIKKREIVALSAANSEVTAFIDALKELLLSRGLVDDSTALCAEITETT